MRSPTQTRLSSHLTASQMARVGEIECLIIIIRRLSTNLEKSDAIRVCEYLLSGQGAPRAGFFLPVLNGRPMSRTLIMSGISAQCSGIRQWCMDTDSGSCFKLSAVREGVMSRLGDRGFLELFIAGL